MGEDAPDSEAIPPFMADLRNEIGKIGRLAANLEGLPDPKVDVLQQVVADKQADDNNKVLVFSTFRHTLRYLEEAGAGLGRSGRRRPLARFLTRIGTHSDGVSSFRRATPMRSTSCSAPRSAPRGSTISSVTRW